MAKTPITVAYGDGIGPEIMEACLLMLKEAGAEIEITEVMLGQKAYQSGILTGISEEAWESIRHTNVLYKAPLTTPQGEGYKSVNVTLRKSLGLYANIRPVVTYTPYIHSSFENLNIVIVRENEEDLYGAIEHRQTDEVYQTLKLITRPGTEKIVRYAFEYARRFGRQKVTCMTKDNIMKLTDGLFHKVFNEIALEYPEIESEHMIIDIGSARLAASPAMFDVIVTLNLYGDIISDIAAQIAGSVGLAGSANIGDQTAMFEAVHGSAPDITGKGLANPTGLMHAGSFMMRHIGQPEVSVRLRNAWRVTIEDGIHTPDIYRKEVSKKLVGTLDFAKEVIKRLGKEPKNLPVARVRSGVSPHIETKVTHIPVTNKELIGVDVFLDWSEGGRNPNALGEQLSKANGDGLDLIMITNRGQKVWPADNVQTLLTDHWRCRFQMAAGEATDHAALVALLKRITGLGLEFIKIENLYSFDGVRGFSLGQGQ